MDKVIKKDNMINKEIGCGLTDLITLYDKIKMDYNRQFCKKMFQTAILSCLNEEKNNIRNIKEDTHVVSESN